MCTIASSLGKASGADILIGLTPDTQYPIQLTQAANGLRYLLEVAKVPVKNVRAQS